MGIVVDMRGSSLMFSSPPDEIALKAIINTVHCIMHTFTMRFALKFEPSRGVSPPATRELWTIGIVQNVIYQSMLFEYNDGAVFSTTFRNAVLDSSAAETCKPFYHDPVIVPGCEFHPELSCRQYVDVMVPVRTVWYATDGFGELLSPLTRTGVALQNETFVNLIDRPSFGARLRRERAILIRAEHIISFGAWLVAKTRTKIHVLAHVPDFSLVFWATTQPAPGLLSIHVPDHQFGYYGSEGIVRRVNQNSTLVPRMRLLHGPGQRTPVLDGETANERGRNWLERSGLLP